MVYRAVYAAAMNLFSFCTFCFFLYLELRLYGMVGKPIVSSNIPNRKKRYFCRELVVYPEDKKYRTSGQAYEVIAK